MEADAKKYNHSCTIYDFSKVKNAFFSFTINRQVDSADEIFSISCIQQGNRLQSYRNKVQANKRFQPSRFSILLMTADGRWVNATHTGWDSFNAALLLKEGFLLPGTYFVCIDPAWDPSANFNADYKKVMIDVYSPLSEINLQLVSEQ